MTTQNMTRTEMTCKLRAMRDEADELLAIAHETDCPEAWDSWKEADGAYYGYQDAMMDAFADAA